MVALSLATASGIAVSAPRQSVNSLHNGAIYVFPISGELKLHDDSGSRASPCIAQEIEKSDCRFR